ncbi:hypothetical protein MmiAt1_03810 [Methanimicrococcus sp. At1]|uniref:Uncharacterized protein n=2 Tax=Methanimicrococcus hacksteinii TaxID=3028293 RepID=A0ABU3VN55_9EURY|nr:hypothetical protein [Methanimicrococcus sp. At1]
MILYAQWTRDTSVKYTVTYKANGGIGTDYAVEVLPEDNHTIASVDDAGFTRYGFTFTEWNADENGGGQNYSAGAEITPTGDMILYAQWTRDTSVKYTVTYKANGGIGTDYIAEVLPEENHTIASVDDAGFARYGFTFTEWNIDESGGGQNYSSGTEITPTGDMILYAQWTRDTSVKYTVTYKANGGIGTVSDTLGPYAYNAVVTVLDGASLIKEGSKFIGWSKDQSAAAADLNAGDTFKITEDTELFAVYETDSGQYTVTYNSNGGTGTVEDTAGPYAYNAEVTVLDGKDLVKEDEIFIGWSTNQTAFSADPAYASGGTFRIRENVELFAIWNSTDHPSTGGGSGTGTATVKNGTDDNGGNNPNIPGDPGTSKPPEGPDETPNPPKAASVIILLFLAAVAVFVFNVKWEYDEDQDVPKE